MRCFSCDCNLTDYESTLKSAVTGEYIDMCTSCISEAGLCDTSVYVLNTDCNEEEYNDDTL